MDDKLSEWKAQREQIARHLAWLDAQIAQREETTAPKPIEERREVIPSAPAPVLHPELAAAIPTPEEIDTLIERSPGGGLQSHQQFGCIALGVLAIAGVIFLFFFLPGLIYD